MTVEPPIYVIEDLTGDGVAQEIGVRFGIFVERFIGQRHHLIEISTRLEWGYAIVPPSAIKSGMGNFAAWALTRRIAALDSMSQRGVILVLRRGSSRAN